jgi:hypothetical protein
MSATRETVLARLAEAAEVEHCLMCVYLYAAFSLKGAEELPAEDAALVAGWRGQILAVAREEMVHLLLVNNLLTAIGGPAQFSRMNFPVPAGYLPADMQVRLAPFDRDTIQHLVWLERPAGSSEPMGKGFAPTQRYQRAVGADDRLMPHAKDYATVGELYEMIVADLESLAARLGEDALFIGDPAGQVDETLIQLPGVRKVICLKSAKAAIAGIVEQGEGASESAEQSHFQRFVAIRDGYDAVLKRNPHFAPARPAAHNPVMRRPPTPEGKVWIEAEDAARVVDLANALYLHMLRCLTQAFGHAGGKPAQSALIDAAIDLMFAITPTATYATTLPARPGDAGCAAGMSFAMTRALSPLPPGPAEWRMLGERFDEIAAGAAALATSHAALAAVAADLATAAARFHDQAAAFSAPAPSIGG